MDAARPNDDAGIPHHSGTSSEDGTFFPQPVPDYPIPFGAAEGELHGLLEALQGVSFLTDQVTELRAAI